jgi:response regulator RpfG family c-di-GMP phosphodiesterase
MSDSHHVLDISVLFHDLDRDTLDHIAEQCEEVSYDAGATIFCEGDEGNVFFILSKGEVSLYKQMGTGERRIRKFITGEHFGEMALISRVKRSGTVRADADSECLVVSEAGFNTLMDTEPRFAQRMLHALTERLRQTDEAATRDMVAAHHALSFSLANLADSRDPETGAHLYRVRSYCQLLAGLLADHPKYEREITDEFIENIYLVAPLHDIGKVAIPDGVLLKPGKLTDAEFKMMSKHTTLGAKALDDVLQYCDFELFHMARRVILCHHEQWDGKGYPYGVVGAKIPLEARIMAVADNYDALLSERVYKPAFSYDKASEMMQAQSGFRFDPDMIEVMMSNIGKFEDVHRQFVEHDAKSS